MSEETEQPLVDKDAAPRAGDVEVQGRLEGNCIHCHVAMGAFLGMNTPEGPIHNECVPAYRRAHVERCAHCDNALKTSRTIINGKKVHPDCLADFKAKKPYEPPTKSGTLSKFALGRSFFGKKNWKERFFVCSKQTGLCYYDSEDAHKQGKAPKGVVPLSAESRLVTKPGRHNHTEAKNISQDFLIIFSEQGTERKLLMSAKSWQDKEEWIKVLECHLKLVDDPRDIVE